jgi:hypothetical protein
MIFQDVVNHLIDCLKTVVCTASVITDIPGCTDKGEALYATPTAKVAALFALYMFIVGIVFVIPYTGRRLCRLIDFPEDFQQWAKLFAGAIFVVALFYATAARQPTEMADLHWVSVFGRLLVFFACLWLCIRGNGHGLTLLLLGLVDGGSALLSAYYLAANPVAGMVLVGGLWQLVLGVVFVMFPGTLAQLHTRRPRELLARPATPSAAGRGGSVQTGSAQLVLAHGTLVEVDQTGPPPGQIVAVAAEAVAAPADADGFRNVSDIFKSARQTNLDEENRRWALIFAVVLAALGSYATLAGKMGFERYYSPVMVGHLLAAAICGSIGLTNPRRYWPVLMLAGIELALGLGTLYFMMNS